MSVEEAPWRKRRRASARKRQERYWATKSGPVITYRLSRSEVREVACPRCGAEAGMSCVAEDEQERSSNHRERIAARMKQ